MKLHAPRPRAPWRTVLSAAVFLLAVVFVCLFLGLFFTFPLPFAVLSWPWAVAATALAGALILLGFYWYYTR